MDFHIRNYGTVWRDRDLFQMCLVATEYYDSETEYQDATNAAGERWDELKEFFMVRNPERVRYHRCWRGSVVQLRFQN